MITIHPVAGIPEVEAGDDVADLIIAGLAGSGLELIDGDVVVVTHKIVSKAEGRTAPVGDDDAYRAVVSGESTAILRRRGDLVISRTRHGYVCANAGVDRSNAPNETAILLPIDPDRSAHGVRAKLSQATGAAIGVIISDTFGRAWRIGQTDVAIGVAGVMAVTDLRGTRDSAGRELSATITATADELAAAADLVMGKAAGIPVAVVRGCNAAGQGRASELVRGPADDFFL